MRRLIINADDFGLTLGINRAIVEAHTRGMVTSTTLMANGAARDAATELVASNSHLSVGCHIVLVDGKPILAPEKIASLVENRGNAAQLREKLAGMAANALLGRLDPEHIEAEATAQIRLLQEKGISLTHFDTHKHTHIVPSVLRPLLRAAKACGIGALRNPFGPRLPLSLRDLRQRPNLWKRFLEVKVLATFASSFRRTVAQFGLCTPDGSFGVVSTGALDSELFAAIVDCIPDGTWEFVCHPGYNDSELASVRTRLRESRQKELEVLTSAAAREALDRRGIQLISYREL
ncbi:MAG TPA: ChbG/HpnK family deacetylase [Terriglobales bacterium]